MPLVFDDDSSSAGGRLVFDDEQPKQDAGFIQRVKEFGTRFVDNEVAGIEERSKRKRQEEYDRSNSLNAAQVVAQTHGLNDAERAQQDAAAAYQEKYRSSVGGRVADTIGAGVNLSRDLGLGLVKGGVNTVVKLPIALGGVAEDATGTRASLESIGVRSRDALGVIDQFGKWMDSLKSDSGQARDRDFNATKGVVDTLGELGASPAMVMDKVSESLVGIGVIGKTAGAAVESFLPRLAAQAKAAGLTGEAAADFIAQGAAKVAQIAAPVSEGLQSGLDIAGTAQEAGRSLDQYGVAALSGGLGTAAIGMASNKLGAKMGIGDVETDIALRGTGVTSAKTGAGGMAERFLKEGAKEGFAEELPQSVNEAIAENVAMGRPWDQGVGKSAATGAVAGFAMGGGHTAFGSGDTAQTKPGAPPEDTLNTPLAPAIITPEATNRAATPEVSAAEKALMTPVELTSLDRVNEIEKQGAELSAREAELSDTNGYGPMFDQERQEVATQRAELEAEKLALTKDWPKSIDGTTASFSTEAGARVEAKYALMDAADLVTSHDTGLRQNPAYPQELQPRARDRAASEMQVSSIVQKLDPARLGLSADAANGAPIVGADGLVESGNARTIALMRVYQANGQKASDYKQFLRDNAAQFGITPESVDSLQKPVLVRVRTTPVNRAEFARQANASTVAAMSPSEQAKSDSSRIDSMEDLSPDDQGDFSNATSKPFIRRFMARLPATEQSAMIDAAGNLSTAGYARVRNAVLAKAYGDSPVLQRMTESMDDNLRNVSRALMLAAPKVAAMREAVGAGNRFDADITPDLMSAVEELSRLKDAGTSVDDALAQAGMFGDKYSPETGELLQFLASNMRRPRKIADFIGAYMDALDAAGDPNQGSLLGDTQAPAKQDLLKAAERNTQDATQDTERGVAGKDAQAGPQTAVQPKDAPGGEGRAQGDGATGRDTRLSRKQNTKSVGEKSEWVDFPKDSGTIGIPRADMPQIKGEHRGALIQFLQGRGIEHKTEEVKASTLKPTQAEFSTKKAARWSEVRDSSERSVLVSSDGHILDGHHQWVAALAANEPVKAIVLDAPIRELMTNVFQFPSVVQSQDSRLNEDRSAARQDFKQVMADLADLVADTLGTRVMMMPPNNPKLQAILVKLFDSAIRVVGTDLKAATKWVKDKLKSDPATKPWWNKITDKDYQTAALSALEQSAKVHVDDLFAAAEARQADMFADAPAAPKVAMIDGKPYDMKRDNFKEPAVADFVDADVLGRADGYVEKYYKDRPPVNITPDERTRAEGVLRPLLDKANADKVLFDQKIIDITKRAGAVGQLLAPVKSMDRAVEKLVDENKFDLSKMFDTLRSTIVVNGFSEAQSVIDEIKKEFTLSRPAKNRTEKFDLNGLPATERKDGYADLLVNVKLASGLIAEIQINVPEMLAAKKGQGHKLYEAQREAPKESTLGKEIGASMTEFYDAAFDAANSRQPLAYAKNADSVEGSKDSGLGSPAGKRVSPSSESPKTLPSGKTTRSSPPTESKNSQPAGNESGNFITVPIDGSLSGKPVKGYEKNPDVFASTRTAAQIAHDIGKSSPDGDVTELREQARKAIMDALGQKALDEMGRGHMFRNDDLTQAVHDGQYEALAEYAAAMPVPVHEDDIPRDTAIGSYSGISHSPERRGASARRDYVRTLASAWRTAERMTEGDPEGRERVTEVMGDLVAGYRERYLAALNSQSRVMSSMIAGPARFPVESNRKKSDTADRRSEEASDFLRKGIARLSKAAKAPIDKSPDAARAQVTANLESREAQQARMKAVNAAHSKFQKDPASLDKSDLPDTDKTLIREYTPKYSWEPHPFAPYELTNNNAEIKRLRARLAETEKRVEAAAAGPVESSRPGVRVEENATDDRLRLFFDEKPDEAVRTDLKANGFKWSPNAGAWQRQLTDNARNVTSRLLDKYFPSIESGTTTMSRGAGGGMDLKALKSLAYRIRSNMPNMPDVHVLDSPKSAPKALRAYIEAQGAMDDVEGAMHKGALYLFASGLSDPLRAEHVLAEHEAAHFGLRAILGSSLNAAMLAIYNNNTYIRQLATELQKRGKLTNAEATEEAIVDIPSARLVKLQGWRKVAIKVRDWLSGHGFDAMAAKLSAWLDGSLSEQQRADLFVADLVRAARAYIAGKGDGKSPLATGTMLSGTLAEDIAKQEKWLTTEAKARGYANIDELAEKNYPLFEKLATLWRQKNPADNGVLLSRAPALAGTAAQRAEAIIKSSAGTAQPLDKVVKTLTKITGIELLTNSIYNGDAIRLIDQLLPTPLKVMPKLDAIGKSAFGETVKAGMVADYGVPEAVIDRRALMQGHQRVQLRKAGTLIDKLSTLTRAESRVAYQWLNETDPLQIYTLMQNLPEESVKVLMEVQTMIDKLSKEAVRMGQLTADAYERNKFAYLRRSYEKYTLAQTPGEKVSRARAISILGEQYKGRGLTEAATMQQIQSIAPEWWMRKMIAGKADTSLKGERLLRLERRAPSGERTGVLPGVDGNKQAGKLREVVYWPAGETIPSKFSEWSKAGTFEVRDVKGDKVVLWRDFTKDEREKMGEIDEARFAIAKTLHAMIHDVEVGRHLEWLAHNYAKKEGETIPGTVVEASERYKDTFAPGTWVRVPDSKIPGTAVLKYGKLAGRYLPGPVWNDLRQTVNGQFRPFGDTYSKLLSWWKTSKTALSPGVHTNNIMSNFVMADWHDVTAGHTAKALRILMAAHERDGKGFIGGAGNVMAKAVGMVDREAAREIMIRYRDSGGDIGSWATNEVANSQIEPMLEAMEKELVATNGNSAQAQVGVYQALQHAMMMRFPSAFEALKGSKTGKIVATEGGTLIDMYQAEDDVFRLAAWLKAKEDGRTDMEAGKIARVSFMDYHINAPWVQALRNSALPFVSYSYRAVPMMLEIAGKKPHKLIKLMAFAGALNAFGVLLSGGGDDDERERKLLPEEKAGRIWGMVPKLIRMPWNDANSSPVYLDIRRFIPVGDVFDIGAGHSAVPILPSMTPGGPLAIIAELVLNKTQFTGKPIVLETDTIAQQATKVLDYLFKALAPNVLGLPGSYATTSVTNAATGKTDAFGRQQSTVQAVASSFGVKLGSYPADVLAKNLQGQAQAKLMEIDKTISGLKRQLQLKGISQADFDKQVKTEQEKKTKLEQELTEKLR